MTPSGAAPDRDTFDAAIGGDPGEPGPPHISRDPGEPGPPARKIGPPPARKGGPRPAKAAPPAKPPAPTPGELARLDQRPGAWQTPPGPGQNGLNLVAVVQGKRPQAVFKLRGAYVRAREGDKVGDYTVERIAEREVYLLQGGHRDRLPLAKRGAPPAGETKEPAKSEQPEEPAADEPAAAPVKKARPRLGPPLPLSPGGPGKQS